MKRDFDPASPDAAWCTDITYIWTYDDGFVYLTSVMDLFSRKIISWVLTKDMTAESVLEAIKIAQKRRNIRKPVIIHSDRGIQFTGELYKENNRKMKRSYSKKACPWDNACIESFHSLIKAPLCKGVVIIRLFTMFRAHCISISHLSQNPLFIKILLFFLTFYFGVFKRTKIDTAVGGFSSKAP